MLDRCRDRGWKLATAESCTGGLVAAGLTAIPGSSEVVVGGIVSYANEVKIAELGVPAELIEEHGAVSAEVAEAMARGARERLGVEVALVCHRRRRAGRRHGGEARRARLLPRRDAGGRPRLVVQLPGRPRLDQTALGRRRPAPRAANVGTEW